MAAYNVTLVSTYTRVGELQHRWKEAVKARMGWVSDNPFYDRIKGRVKCTPAEQQVFSQTFKEIAIMKPVDLFPATEEITVLAE